MKKGVILGNMGYQRGNRAVMLLKLMFFFVAFIARFTFFFVKKLVIAVMAFMASYGRFSENKSRPTAGPLAGKLHVINQREGIQKQRVEVMYVSVNN